MLIEDFLHVLLGRDRPVVRTPFCGRGNTGSNPGHSKYIHFTYN